MKKIKQIYKGRSLDWKFFERVDELGKETRGLPKNGFIPNSYLYSKLCRNFSITKRELREIIISFSNEGFLEISSLGIKPKFVIKIDHIEIKNDR